MNASSATQHLASNATAALGPQPTPMLNHWLQGLLATTMELCSQWLHCEENKLPKPTLSSQVWCLTVCLDQHFWHCHINVTLLYNMEEINKDTEVGAATLPKRRVLSPHWNVLKWIPTKAARGQQLSLFNSRQRPPFPSGQHRTWREWLCGHQSTATSFKHCSLHWGHLIPILESFYTGSGKAVVLSYEPVSGIQQISIYEVIPTSFT